MRQLQFRARACVTAVLLAVCAATASAQIVRVGGIVKDDTGQPIKGATVTALNEDFGQSLTATTDDKGRFLMIGLRGGQWWFVAQAPGHAPQASDLAVRTGAVNVPVTFALSRTGAANYGALAGITAKDLQGDLAAADTLLRQQRWDDAAAAYRTILTRAPSLTAITLQIAAAYLGKKDYTRADATYNEALKADPSNEKARIGLSLLNAERGDMKAAEDTLLEGADRGPGREIPYRLAELKLARGERDEAMKWFEKASAADPFWGKPLYRLGLAAIEKGDREGAAKFLDRVIAVDPQSPEASSAKAALSSLTK